MFFFFILCCASKKVHTERYKVTPPGQSWKAVESGGADHAWYNKDLGGVIYIDSNCEKQFEDRSLKDSLNSLTAGIAIGQPLAEQTLFVDGREGLMVIRKGRLDGVDVQISAANLAKNQCLYDFIYIAPPHKFSYGLQPFVSTVHSFQSKEHPSDGFTKDSDPATSAPKTQ